MNDLYFYFLTVVGGLCIGSFLNVLIYRLPRNKKIVFDRSACPRCGTGIRFYDNIPVLGYIFLKGRCRECKERISARYPLVELLNGGIYLFLAWYLGWGTGFYFFAYLSSALIVIFFIDLDFQIIPDSITLPGILIGLAVSLHPDGVGIIPSVIGLMVGGGSMYLVAVLGEKLFKKEALGGGDIKMAAMLGAFLGWQKVVIIFFGGALLGMIISVIIMSFSAKLRESRMIPFGPFLAVAAFISMLFGDSIIAFYIRNFLDI